MKLSIIGSGADIDDSIVTYNLRAETSDFKGTVAYYGYADIFDTFAEQLLLFPFTSKQMIRFKADGVAFKVSLLDPAGRINFNVSIKDSDNNHVAFSDQTVETEMLHKLARLLIGSNFATEAEVIWSTDT